MCVSSKFDLSFMLTTDGIENKSIYVKREGFCLSELNCSKAVFLMDNVDIRLILVREKVEKSLVLFPNLAVSSTISLNGDDDNEIYMIEQHTMNEEDGRTNNVEFQSCLSKTCISY